MASPDFNQQIVAEFRANGGKVGRMFEGMPMLLLTTTGAKSGSVGGTQRTSSAAAASASRIFPATFATW